MIDLEKGTRVKTVYGDWVAVMRVEGHFVIVYENGPRYVHIDKLMLSTAFSSENAMSAHQEKC